jgi:anti-sigma factor RsiW
MTTCKQVYLHVCESLDEDLDTPRCREIRKHLAKCPRCREYMATLKNTIALYRSQPEVRTPRTTHAGLVAAIASEMKRHGSHPHPRRKRSS